MPPPRKAKGKGKARDNGLDSNGRPAKLKRVKEVVFDPEARKFVQARSSPTPPGRVC